MPRRSARRSKFSVLAVGEGRTEVAFLTHVKTTYRDAIKGIREIKIRDGQGGAPRSVLERTIRLNSHAVYQRTICLVDADRIASDHERRELHTLAQRSGIQLFISEPCMEAVLLGLLNPTEDWSNQPTATVERAFHNHVGLERKTDPREYERYSEFSREAIDTICEKVQSNPRSCLPAHALLNEIVVALFRSSD